MSDGELVLSVAQTSKPFRAYDVSSYDVLKIDGFFFPIVARKNIRIINTQTMKKPATIKTMIERFKNQGITFTAEEEKDAEVFLISVNYYRLSVFRLYLTEDFSFTALKELYGFDRFLREQLNILIPPVEVYIKTTLAYFLSNEYLRIYSEPPWVEPALVYLDDRIYKDDHIGNGDVKRMLSNFVSLLSDKQDKDPSIKHHVQYYCGQIPIWALVEHLTLGQMSTFVTYLSRPLRKEWVEKYVPSASSEMIIGWLNTIRILRNTGAHCSRFYGRYYNYSPKIPREDLDDVGYENLSDEQKDKFKNTLFAGLLILRKLYLGLDAYEKVRWNEFLKETNEKINNHSNFKLSEIGFPNNWQEVLYLPV